jgi:uncharacterized protein
MFRTIGGWFAKGFGTRPAGQRAAATPPATRKCERCGKATAIHITRVRPGEVPGTVHLCEECATDYLPISTPNGVRFVGDASEAAREVQMVVDTVIISEVSDQQMIIFREVDGTRLLSFETGIFEATVVERTLTGFETPRPLTHDAWLGSIAALGASVQAACVHDRHQQTYYAELRLAREIDFVRVDMRPSDALILALKAGAPFFFTERLLAENALRGEEPV